jgi:hypothetical protein
MEPNTISVPSQPVQPVQPQDLSAGTLLGPVNLFKTTWNFFKNYYKTIIPIFIIPSLIFVVAQISMLIGSGSSMILGFVLLIVGIILSIASGPAVTSTIHRLATEVGAVITLKDQYKFGFKIFWSVVLIAILQLFISFGSAILFVIPAIIVGVYLSMYMFTLVIDGKRGFESLTESFSLVKGRWWPVLGRFAFIAVAYLGCAIVIAILSFLIEIIFGIEDKSLSQIILNMILNLVLTSTAGSFMVVYSYNLYTNLKNTRIPNVYVADFKKWLIAFAVIGVIAAIGFFVVGSMLVQTLKKEIMKGALNSNFQSQYLNASIKTR